MRARGPDGTPDVIRGEESPVLGASEGGSEHFVTPGTHSKWITVENQATTSFCSYMTGEVFCILKTHSILGKLMTGETGNPAALELGVKQFCTIFFGKASVSMRWTQLASMLPSR